jgi:uncharacterized membrane protein
MGVGSLLLLAVGFIVEGVPQLDLFGWGIVLWLAIVNTALAFTIWNHTLQTLTAIESTLINNTMLVQIAILAWLFLGEPVSARESIGLILAVMGVLFVQLAGDRSKERSPTNPSAGEQDASTDRVFPGSHGGTPPRMRRRPFWDCRPRAGPYLRRRKSLK